MGNLSNIPRFISTLRLIAFNVLLFISFCGQALETNFELHHGFNGNSAGYAFGLADKFSVRSPIGWSVSYHDISELSADWNNEELFFDSATIDTVLTYSYQPRSYNKLMKKVSFELQAGLSWQLTDNSFIWQDLDQEKIFSEKGDMNTVVALVTHYNFSPKMSCQLGFKYYPTFSEFEPVSSIFAGISYRFGRQYGY